MTDCTIYMIMTAIAVPVGVAIGFLLYHAMLGGKQ